MISPGRLGSLVLIIGAVGGDARHPSEHRPSWGIAEASPPALEVAAASFARAWSQGDLSAIGSLTAAGGVKLHLEDTAHGFLGPRQVVATLGSFLEGRESRGTQVLRVSNVGGSPPRGFSDMTWKAVRSGTVEVLTYRVYVGFVLEEEAWRVAEIRVIR